MNTMAKSLFIKWIVCVMYMLCARAEIFSLAEREELARITADLQAALQEK